MADFNKTMCTPGKILCWSYLSMDPLWIDLKLTLIWPMPYDLQWAPEQMLSVQWQ